MRIKQSFFISFVASVRSFTFVSQCGLSLLFHKANTALSFQPMASLRMPINIQQKFNYNQRLHQTFGAMTMDPNYTDDDELSSLQQLQEAPASTPTPELASIVPGQVLSIRIGDTNLSRKAWKKRRRSNSPILVPCTILGIDRQMMVAWNVMNLLHRFGKPLKNVDGRKSGGVVLSTKACARFYKRTLGSSLLDHVQALGYPTIDSFLESTFDEYYYAEYGVQFIHLDNSQQQPNNNNDSSESITYLSSTLSLRRARESASKACFLQFLSDPTSSSNMLHTGATVIPNTRNGNSRYYSSPPLPLSAAVRLSSMSDLSSDRIWSGMDSRAFVLSYEAKGDNGSPLLVCTIDPPKVQIREATRRRVDVRRKRDWMESERVANDILARRTVKKNAVGKVGGKMRSLEELRIGDGPIRASIVKISAKAGAAFVDLGVERKRGKKRGGGKERVLGMLRLDDVIGSEGSGLASGGGAVLVDEEDGIETWFGGDVEEEDDDDFNYEEDEEIVDDITDMFSLDDDGNISMTESSSFTSDVIFESDNPSTDDEDDDMFAGIEAHERLELIEEMLVKEETSPTDDTPESKEIDSAGFICVGNEIDVYIRSVFTQSGRFMVTLDPSIKGRKPKELKRERESKKRMTKLAEKENEGEGLQQILDNVGMECNGTVKAKSKKGNWYYVQPDHAEGLKFPVGVAQTEIEEDLSPGDRVWVRLDGIDESRGQLAMTLLKQIYPDS